MALREPPRFLSCSELLCDVKDTDSNILYQTFVENNAKEHWLRIVWNFHICITLNLSKMISHCHLSEKWECVSIDFSYKGTKILFSGNSGVQREFCTVIDTLFFFFFLNNDAAIVEETNRYAQQFYKKSCTETTIASTK